ncbi:MAG: alpha-galactosidase, partial [Trebonia sp.]
AARTWARYAGGWRTGRDIDCYCSTTSYPLTNWANVAARFDSVARWAPYGHPGTFNDYDSIEVGNGPADDGITDAEAQSQLSLWSMAASPLLLGLFNYSGSASQTVSVSLAAAGIDGSATATNLWTGAPAGTLSGTYSVTLGPGAVQLLKLTPVSGTTMVTPYDAASPANTLAGGAMEGNSPTPLLTLPTSTASRSVSRRLFPLLYGAPSGRTVRAH